MLVSAWVAMGQRTFLAARSVIGVAVSAGFAAQTTKDTGRTFEPIQCSGQFAHTVAKQLAYAASGRQRLRPPTAQVSTQEWPPSRTDNECEDGKGSSAVIPAHLHACLKSLCFYYRRSAPICSRATEQASVSPRSTNVPLGRTTASFSYQGNLFRLPFRNFPHFDHGRTWQLG